MTAKAKKPVTAAPVHLASPFEAMAYRALVYARDNGTTALYYVAGVAGGPWASNKALASAHRKHGGACFYCKKSIESGKATIDHVEPVSLGGKNTIQNQVIACQPCNARKGQQVIDAFNPAAGKDWLQALLKQIQQRLDRL